MFEKSSLVDEVIVRTKNVLSIKAFIKRHKITSVLILLDITMLILLFIIPSVNDFRKSEFLQILEFLLVFVVFVLSFLLIGVCDMYYEDDKDFHIEIDTLNEKDVAFLNDVLIFPSEPLTQDEKKSIDDILKLYETIQSGKKSIQNHEDMKVRQHVRETYKTHQSSSQTLNGLMEQLEQVDDDIKLEIQQKLNENNNISKTKNKHR